MADLQTIFWAASDFQKSGKALETLGFELTPSRFSEGQAKEIFFGPDLITIVPAGDQTPFAGLNGRTGIVGIGVDNRSISGPRLNLNRKMDSLWLSQHNPEAFGMNAGEDWPRLQPNTCWGIEGIHVFTSQYMKDGQAWGAALHLPVERLHWRELHTSEGKRLRIEEKFLDFLKTPEGHSDGVFLVTLRVTDLENLKTYFQKNQIPVLSCATRDGFIVPGSFTGGPALRFVRTAWKKWTPVSEKGRREDSWLSLGGVYVSTLTGPIKSTHSF